MTRKTSWMTLVLMALAAGMFVTGCGPGEDEEGPVKGPIREKIDIIGPLGPEIRGPGINCVDGGGCIFAKIESRKPPHVVSPTALEEQAVGLAFSTGAKMTKVRLEAIKAAIDWALFATQITGSPELVTIGTLQQTTPNSATFVYTATPQDRLQITYADDSPREAYVFSELTGSVWEGGHAFLSRPHAIRVRTIIEGTAEIEFADSWQDGVVRGSNTGTLPFGHEQVDVTITTEGITGETTTAQGDEFTLTERTTGRLTGEDMALTIDEQQTVSTTQWGIQPVSRTEYVMNTSWTLGADTTFAFENLIVRQSFFDGAPTSLEWWASSEGSLSRDEQPVGQVFFDGQTASQFRMAFHDGRQMGLDAFQPSMPYGNPSPNLSDQVATRDNRAGRDGVNVTLSSHGVTCIGGDCSFN